MIQKLKKQEKNNTFKDRAKLPRIAILGNQITSSEVAKKIREAGVRVDKYSYLKDLKNGFTGSELGIIYVTPLIRGDILKIHKNLIKKNKFMKIPFFAIVPEWLSGQQERQMYKTGVSMIFEWPKDQSVFTKFIKDIQVKKMANGHKTSEDEALVQAVRNRVKLEKSNLSSNIDYVCYNGMILLQGTVNSLREKREVVNFVKIVPGVRGVLDSSLNIKPSRISSQVIKNKAQASLGLIQEFDPKTLRLEVKDGCLTIEGNVPSLEIKKNIIESLADINGISSIKNFIVVAKDAYLKDKTLAHRASKIVKKTKLTKAKDIRIKVTNGTARILGRVNHPMEKVHLENILRSLDGVQNVENHLLLTSI